MHIGESEVAALGAVGEAFMIKAEAVEQGRLDVVNVDGIFDDVIAEVIGSTVDDSGFDATAGQPHAVGFRVVVATA